MACKLTVTADGDEGWAIFVDRRPIVDFDADGVATLPDFNSGEHTLTYDVRGAGATLNIDLEGHPPIVVPVGAKWPFEVKVPQAETAAADRIYFWIGA